MKITFKITLYKTFQGRNIDSIMKKVFNFLETTHSDLATAKRASNEEVETLKLNNKIGG